MQIETVSLATTGGLKVNNEFFVLTVRGQALIRYPIVGAWIDICSKNQEMRIHLD